MTEAEAIALRDSIAEATTFGTPEPTMNAQAAQAQSNLDTLLAPLQTLWSAELGG